MNVITHDMDSLESYCTAPLHIRRVRMERWRRQLLGYQAGDPDQARRLIWQAKLHDNREAMAEVVAFSKTLKGPVPRSTNDLRECDYDADGGREYLDCIAKNRRQA